MRSLFGKYWSVYLVGVTLNVFVLLVVLTELFRPANSVAAWFFGLIKFRVLALSTFHFIIDWASVISAFSASLVVFAVYMRIRQGRRRQALRRVHDWARNAVLELTTPLSEVTVAKKLAHFKQRMIIIRAESDNALTNARTLGNGLEPEVEKAVKNLLEFEDCLNDHTESADVKTLLKTTVSAFREIIN